MALHLNLELTDHCNIRCRMCSQSMRDEAHGEPHRFMDWEVWRQSLRGLADSPEPVHLCPHWLGEPTLHPQFDRFVEYAFAVNPGNRLFREFKLHTNAVLFHEERARLLVRLAMDPAVAPDTFRQVHFSIDAHSPEVYRVVKGADRGAVVYRNVRRFLEVRAELGATRPRATLAFVVQPENAHEALLFRDHWLGVLEGLGQTARLCWDWPSGDSDALYFRPLNCGEQEAADRLHAAVCRRLGMPVGDAERLRAAESF
jgi:molybdenum cofactor biosynthesis enzyme MoaA